MRFKVDENLPVEAAGLLNCAGCDATTVAEQGLGGSIDPDIVSVCRQEARILITLDMDFADIRTYPPEQFPGFVVLRLQRQDKPHVLEIFRHLIEMFSREPLEHRLWIVEERRVRIRG